MSERRETNRARWDERVPVQVGRRLFRRPDGMPTLPLTYPLRATAPA